MGLVWHYRTSKMDDVLSIDVLKVIPIKGLVEFARAIWLTKDPIYQYQPPYLAKSMFYKRSLLEIMVRIGIEPYEGLISWNDFIAVIKADESIVEAFDIRYNTINCSKTDWLFSLVNIPKSKWVKIEMMKDCQWVTIWDNIKVVPNGTFDKKTDNDTEQI